MSLSNNELNKISRFLIKLLRHNASEFNLVLDKDGFIECSKLLKLQRLNNITINDIIKIVNICDKQRFNLKKINDEYFIAANQGHSIKIESKLLNPITLDNCHLYKNKNIIHGTYTNIIEKIKKEGLNKMGRIHIHFSTKIDNTKVISGIRKSSNVYIYIDLEKAIKDGFKFYESPNRVILTPGNEYGILPSKYFKNIVYK